MRLLSVFSGELLTLQGCMLRRGREAIWCWANEYWAAMSLGQVLPFDGSALGLPGDWHPFDELVEVYDDLHPGSPIGSEFYSESGMGLAGPALAEFQTLSTTHNYVSFLSKKVLAPPGTTYPPEPAPPPSTPECDHAAFLQALKQAMQQMDWTNVNIADCLYTDEGYLDVILRCPKFDCDDLADSIGQCVRNKLTDGGYTVIGRNKKVILKCPWVKGVGHTIFGIYYCGYWYILDGGAGADAPIGIIPGTPDEIPIDAGTAQWLKVLYGFSCDSFGVIPKGEWDPGTRPFFEGPAWFTDPTESARVIACLRSGGMSDAAIQALLECSVPAEYVDDLEDVLQLNPSTEKPPSCKSCQP